MSKYVILALTVSIIRKRAHLPVFLSLLIPIVLIVVLNSLPSVEQIYSGVGAGEYNERVIGIMRYDIGYCNLIHLDKGLIDGYNEIVVVSLSSIGGELASYLNVKPTNCPDARDAEISASFPRDLFIGMGKKCYVNLTIGESTLKLGITQIHDYLDAVIIETDYSSNRTSYLCVLDNLNLTLNALLTIEKGIQSVVENWLYLLIIASAPLIYVSLVKSISSLVQEFTGLVVTGFEARRLIFYATLSTLFVSLLVIVTIVFISIVSVYTVYFIVSRITIALPPDIKVSEILYYIFLLIMMIVCFVITICRRVINELH